MTLAKYFSLIFSYPTEKNVKEILQYSNIKDIKSLKSITLFSNQNLIELQAEFVRLFVNSYPTLLCPPYESFYKDGSIYGSMSTEIREIYEKNGLKYKLVGEPADHISVELDFLDITNDQSFLKRLKGWVFIFTKSVKQNSDTYGLAAEDLEIFLNDQ